MMPSGLRAFLMNHHDRADRHPLIEIYHVRVPHPENNRRVRASPTEESPNRERSWSGYRCCQGNRMCTKRIVRIATFMASATSFAVRSFPAARSNRDFPFFAVILWCPSTGSQPGPTPMP